LQVVDVVAERVTTNDKLQYLIVRYFTKALSFSTVCRGIFSHKQRSIILFFFLILFRGLRFGAPGAISLARSLRPQMALHHLDLRGCRVLDEGASGHAWKAYNSEFGRCDCACRSCADQSEHYCVGSLRLPNRHAQDFLAQSNAVTERTCAGESGACALGRALADNQSVTSLDLRWNKMGVAGARVFADVLKCMTETTVEFSAEPVTTQPIHLSL
jgi:hypothetical protein